jgi:cell division septum initiation protein DivIVA
MESTDTSSKESPDQGPKKGIVMIVIAILLGTNGLLLWQFFDKKNNLDIANQTIVATTAEKEKLQTEFNLLKADYEKSKSENADLQSQLAGRDSEIKSKMEQIQKLISLGGPAQIARAKAEIARLKEMNQSYTSQIDSLKEANRKLVEVNQTLSTDLSTVRTKADNLTQANEKLAGKVAAGSVLKASNIVTESFRFKSSGKKVLTNKAKQVQNILTRFVLNENKIIDRGPIDLYVRVLNPDGTAMSPDKSTFNANSGEKIMYTVKETVDYNNSDLPVEITWAKASEFSKGKYKVEIYQAGSLIGVSQVELK